MVRVVVVLRAAPRQVALPLVCLLATACPCWRTTAGGPPAQGFFRAVNHDGAWWFVAPDGARFLSLGVNCVQAGPEVKDYNPNNPQYAPLRTHASRDAWAKAATERLGAWGFNTVGGWSDEAVVAQKRLPYTSVIHLGNRLGAPWFDIFAEDYEAKFDTLVAEFVAPHRDDPLLLGWFIDNELGWSAAGLFANHIKQSADNRTRGQLIRLLRAHYLDRFDALRADFDVGAVESFEQLGLSGEVRLKPGGRGAEVVDKFTRLLADRYYHVAHDALRRHDPNHLNLGDRYHSYCPIPVVQAAAPYVDVVSTNYDWPDSTDGHVPPHIPQLLHRASGKPVLISEFYVAAAENRSGNRNTGGKFTVVANQEHRAAALQRRLQRLMATPYIVGAHWFQFADEPTKGRFDGEDYNFGLVDIHDKPYEKLVATLTQLHAGANDIHRAATAARDGEAKPAGPTAIPPAPADAGRSLAAWDKELAHVPSPAELPIADLYACWDARAVYLAVHLSDYFDPKVYGRDSVPDEDLATLAVEVQGMNAPLTLVFAERAPCERIADGLAYRSFAGGARHTLLAAIPVARLGSDRLAAGQTLGIRAELKSVARRHTMQWNRPLLLSAGARRGETAEREATRPHSPQSIPPGERAASGGTP